MFAAEEKMLFPQCVTHITIELKMEIPCRYFGKIYPRLSTLKKYFVSCDTGVIDSDFCDTFLVSIINSSKDPILIKAGQRIAQGVFQKRRSSV